MRRRSFLRAGLVLGAAGASGWASTARATTLRRAVRPATGPVPGPVRLASNENPLGMSDAAREAVAAGIGEGNRYPRGGRQELVRALAAKHGVAVENVVLGTGSGEVLQMAVHAQSEGATVVVADPTFEEVAQYATARGLRVERVPLRADWAHDLARMRQVAEGAGGPALVFVCNPNNPTGTLTPSAEVDAWIAASDPRVTFVVDEAYFEFAEDQAAYRSSVRHIASRPNVLVVRTFSKIHAMAGMRLGYGLAHPDLIARLRRFACNNNANHLALVAGLASLNDDAFHRRSLDVNRVGVRLLTRCLDELALAYLPSHSNFVMHRVVGELPAYIDRMRERGFLVGRPFPPMLTYNRVSIGLPEEMEAFTTELRGFRQRGWI